MKRCCTCQVVKPLEEFHRRTASPDGRQARCKQCFAEQYRREGEQLREKIYRRAESLKTEKMRLLVEYLVQHPCVDCGQDDLRVLDFDHREGVEKVNGIAQLMLGGWTWAAVLTEIEKCEVRCANCHRIRTAEQRGWWKVPFENSRRAAAAQAACERLSKLLGTAA